MRSKLLLIQKRRISSLAEQLNSTGIFKHLKTYLFLVGRMSLLSAMMVSIFDHKLFFSSRWYIICFGDAINLACVNFNCWIRDSILSVTLLSGYVSGLSVPQTQKLNVLGRFGESVLEVHNECLGAVLRVRQCKHRFCMHLPPISAQVTVRCM